MQHESEAKKSFTFGDIGIKVNVDGNVDRPDQLVNHILATADAVTSIEVVQYGISDSSSRDEGKFDQRLTTKVEFGDVKVSVEMHFDLNRSVSKRTINSMVFTGILPKIWETVGLYLGDNQSLTNPPAPLTPQLHSDVLEGISEGLSLPTRTRSQYADAVFGPQPSSGQQRQRQMTTR